MSPDDGLVFLKELWEACEGVTDKTLAETEKNGFHLPSETSRNRIVILHVTAALLAIMDMTSDERAAREVADYLDLAFRVAKVEELVGVEKSAEVIGVLFDDHDAADGVAFETI